MLNRAKYLILKYAHDWFIQVRLLASPELEVALNLPSHGLSENELLDLLEKMFNEKYLVATRNNQGLFTPSRNEIFTGLHEKPNQDELFYGYTSLAILEYKKLAVIFGDKQ